MSMKMSQQLQEDHLKLNELLNRKVKNYDSKFDELKCDIEDFREEVLDMLDLVIKKIKKVQTVQVIETTNNNIVKQKEDSDLDSIPTFIPDIDTSDMSINTVNDDIEEIKEVNFDSGLDALDNIKN